MTYGTLTSPVRFTSLNPSQPATFYSIQSTGILISAGGGTTSNDMNIKIDNIIIIGDGGISPSNGNPQSGVFLWLDSNANIPWKNFYLDHVDISGFSLAGLNSWRSYHYSNNFLDTIVVSNSAFHHCPGYPNLQKVSGSGIVLAGVRNVLIETTTVYSNGAQVNYAPGGFGMWVFDADSVVMKNNTAHDNLSQAGDGGGFDLDCGTTNSIIEDCISYNNYGTGYGINACGAGNGYNNDGSTANNMVRRSTSYGDSYGKSDCLACIYAASGTIVNNVTYEDMTMEMTRTLSTVAQFGSGFSASYGAWFSGGVQAAQFQNVLFKFPSTTFFTNAECSNTGTAGPVCNGITTSPSASPLPSPPTAAPVVALKVSSLAPSARPTTA